MDKTQAVRQMYESLVNLIEECDIAFHKPAESIDLNWAKKAVEDYEKVSS